MSKKTKPPQQPENVPNEAVWVGGADGGVWIQCNKAKEKLYKCSLFNEAGGKISSGKYFIDTNMKDEKLHYKVWDGETIHIENGKLMPIGQHIHFYGGSENETWIVDHKQDSTEK